MTACRESEVPRPFCKPESKSQGQKHDKEMKETNKKLATYMYISIKLPTLIHS